MFTINMPQDGSKTKIDNTPTERLRSKNIFSRFFLHYILKVLLKGKKKFLEVEDLFEMEDNQKFRQRFAHFKQYYDDKRKQGLELGKILIHYILPTWVMLFIGFFFNNILTLTFPFFLKELINWFVANDPNDKSGYMWTGLLFGISFIKPFFNSHGMIAGRKCTVIINIAIFGLYFNKINKISVKAARYLNITKVANSLSSDVMRLMITCITGQNILVTPFLIIIFTVILYLELRWVSFIGLVMIAIFTVVQTLIGKKAMSIFRTKFLNADARNKQIKNTIFGIKSIKFNAWENIVKSIVDGIRKKEKNSVFWMMIFRGISSNVSYIMPLGCSLVCIVTYQAIYETLSLGSIFYVIFTFNLFATPLGIFFFALMNLFEAKVALERIKQTLSYPDEIEEESIQKNDEDIGFGCCEIKNGSFSFESKELIEMTNRFLNKKTEDVTVKPVLEDINMKVDSGEFVAIIGEVGCGKTALLQAFSKSMFNEKGTVKKNGKLAYIPQEAFLANATLQTNILLGDEMNYVKYGEILDKCELRPDLEILDAGDMTEIGERGINLSGGQKQRVSIARAIYANADIYLIDDSLSALDSHVGQNIFKNVFKGLIADKTKIMVTHALQYLKDVDKVVFIKQGRIEAQGRFEDLINENEEFRRFVKEKKEKEKSKEEKKDEKKKKVSMGLEKIKNNVNELDKEKEVLRKDAKNTGKLTKDESRFTGQVGFKVYTKFLANGGCFLLLINMILYSIGIFGRILADWWVGAWSIDQFSLTTNQYILYYFLIFIGTFLLLLIRTFTMSVFGSRIGYKIFKNFLANILGKKMSFFDTTPTGQIINLTSKDTDVIDLNLPGGLQMVLGLFFSILGTFILVVVTNIILLPLVVLAWVIVFMIMKLYLRTSTELKRLELIASSPIISDMIELYNGLVIYRGFGRLDYVEKKFEKEVDTVVKVQFHERLCMTYSNHVSELALAILIGAIFFLLVIGKDNSWSFVISNSDIIALNLNWVLSIPLSINFLMFMIAENAKNMSSAQRIFYNIGDADQERNFDEPLPPSNWPQTGTIEAKDISVRYRENLPLVIKKINFQIQDGEKVGIVGRTGSGKSSLILTLTRILELEDEEKGYIKIDGVRINNIGLTPLRENITVIPQDPILMKGTLRQNIDPFDKQKDSEIIEALQQSLLWDSDLFKRSEENKTEQQDRLNMDNDDNTSISDEAKLAFEIEEGGKNLSVGQKQLVCVARALVRHPKILLMDEATSNIDPNTDLKIQEVIKERFSNSTIVTIAHRLNTIIQYDRIFVLDQGELVEQGAPIDLLNTDTVFRAMVRENGRVFEEKMRRCAQNLDQSIVEEFSVDNS